jgi:hypothetical protein
MSEQGAGPRYAPLEVRAAELIARAREAWSDLQRLAMLEDELFDSLVLVGFDLWLPHHETDPSRFGVTLRVGVRYPEAGCGAVEARAASHLAEIGARRSGPEGTVRIAIEPQ